MAKTQQERLERKKEQWITRTAEALHVSPETAGNLLSVTRHQSIRLNPLVADPIETLEKLRTLGWQGKPVEWCQNGFTVDAGLEEVKADKIAQSGAIYIQNAASWLPVIQLNPLPGETILDVCAAPGGKTGHIAAMVNNAALITANDNSRPRLNKLQRNLRILGVKDVEYTLFDASKLSQKLTDTFDAILLDAPCSGEGMMTLQNDTDFTSWSVAHIKRLQQLQKRLLVESWKLLKPGGRLIYSTCTMAPEENEAVVDYLLRHNQDVQVETIKLELTNRVPPVQSWNGKKYDTRLQSALRVIPSNDIEAFFVCKLTKTL